MVDAIPTTHSRGGYSLDSFMDDVRRSLAETGVTESAFG